jgi:hypothetical protein
MRPMVRYFLLFVAGIATALFEDGHRGLAFGCVCFLIVECADEIAHAAKKNG